MAGAKVETNFRSEPGTMSPAPIVLLETDYETFDDAIAARDAQAAQLTDQSIPFKQQTLYRATDGARLFLITPIDLELESDATNRTSAKPRTRRASLQTRRERTRQVNYR